MPLEVKMTAKDEASQKIKAVGDNVRDSVKKVNSANESAAKSHGVHGKAVSGLGMNVGDLIKKFSNMNAAVMAATGSIGIIGKKLIDATNMTATYRDNIGDLSENLNISRELLINFGYAAEKSGSSQEVATSSLTKFSKAVKEGLSGNKELATTFSNLGVSLVNADGSARGMEEVFVDVVEQLGKVKNETDRTSYLFDLFGRSGNELNRTLDELGKNYDTISQRTKDLGLQFSDEERAKADKYKDMVLDMKSAFKGLAMEVGEKAIPAVTKFMEVITNIIAPPSEAEAAPGTWKNKYAEEIRKKNRELENDPAIKALREKMGLSKKTTTSGVTGEPSSYFDNRTDKDDAAAEADMPNEVWAPGQWAFTKRRNEKLEQFKLEGEQSEERKKQAEEVAKNKVKWETWAAGVIDAAGEDIDKQYEDWNEKLGAVADTLTSQVGNAMTELILKGEEFNVTMKKIGESILTSVVGGLTQAAARATMLWGMKKIFGDQPQTGWKGDFLSALGGKHSGGVMGPVRVYHDGGIAPNEVFAKLQYGEGIIPKKSMEKIGSAEFERIRRGKSGRNIQLTVNASSFDEDFVRHRLIPMIDRIERRGR
jgi:hypothetical protein